MTYRSIASKLAPLAICGVMFGGCGSSNEANLKGESRAVPQKADLPNFKNYSEVAQYNMQKAKEQPKKGAKKAP